MDKFSCLSLKELRKKQGSMLQNKMKVETSCDKQSKYMNDGIPECGADALRFTLCSHDFKGKFCDCMFRHLLIRATWMIKSQETKT